MSPKAYCVGWEAGASAQMEIFSPVAPGGESYRLRYTAPLRATIRPPFNELQLGPRELDPIRSKLDGIVACLRTRSGTPGGLTIADVDQRLQLAGSMLFELVVPTDIQAETRVSDLFLEIGIDEALLEYPWELMHDGDDFLCLKHAIGRFVNLSKPSIPSQRRPSGLEDGPLRVLFVSVPHPQPRGGKSFDGLPHAEAETVAIVAALAALSPAVVVETLTGPHATYDGFFKAVKSNRYHIVHFNGHAFFKNDAPRESALVLFDDNLTTGAICNYLGPRPPVLFFMNACETAAAQGTGASWQGRYDLFGLARSFLETGAFLIGTRWKVGDRSAAAFGTAFYSALLSGESLGRCVRDARVACRAGAAPEDLSWASYLFYGDPRVRFTPIDV